MNDYLVGDENRRAAARTEMGICLASQPGFFPCDLLIADLPENPSVENIQNLTRNALILLLYAHNIYFADHQNGPDAQSIAHYVEGVFDRLKALLPPTLEQLAAFKKAEMEFSETIKEQERSGRLQEVERACENLKRLTELCKPRLPIPYLPAAMARLAEQAFSGRQKPREATVDVASHGRFLSRHQATIEAALRPKGEKEEKPLIFQSVAKDAIAILDNDGLPRKIVTLKSTDPESGSERFSDICEIREYRSLQDLPEFFGQKPKNPHLADLIKIFHYPVFFPYLERILPGFAKISLRAQLPILEYVMGQDDDGIRKAMSAWRARLSTVSPDTPIMNAYRMVPESMKNSLEHFLEAFSVCGFDPALQGKLLEIAGRRDATALFFELFRLTQNAEAVTKDILDSYANFGFPAPNRNEILKQLFANASKLLVGYAENPGKIASLVRELGVVTEKLRFMRKIIKNLPPEDLCRFDPEKLSALEFDTIPAADLFKKWEYAGMKEQILAAVAGQFSEADIGDFEKFAKEKNAKLHVCSCEERLVCFFGSLPIAEDALYLDWLTLDRHSPLQSIASPLLNTNLQRLSETSDLLLATKPKVASAKVAIENNGFVCGESVVESPGEHQMLLCRKLRSEKPYRSKALAGEQILRAVSALVPGEMASTEIDGISLRVVTIEGNGNGYTDIMPFLKTEASGVITRLLRMGNRLVFVFEDEALSSEDKLRLPKLLEKMQSIYGKEHFSLGGSKTFPSHQE